ncbi:hypothetical protein OY671_010882, partial [Metschnikowia pulcherrima]
SLAFSFELRTQAADMDIDQIGAGIEAVVPGGFDKHSTRYNSPDMAKEIVEQLELLVGKLDAPIAPPTGAREQIEFEVRNPSHVRRDCGSLCAPNDRRQPCNELVEGEGLRQIVVSASVQSADAILDSAERTEDQDGSSQRLSA